jgi:uncharacterized repeat protein (TIGR01451 family)
MTSPLRHFKRVVKEVSRNYVPRSRRHRRRLLFEPLEGRVLLVADSLASIAGTAFVDGLVDAPLEMAVVQLYSDGGDGVFDRGASGGDDSLVGSAATDASGAYRFDHLTASTYFVTQLPYSGLYQRPGEEVQTVIITDTDAAGAVGLSIDSFASTTQLVEDPGDMLPSASAVDVLAGEAIGGERDLSVERLSGMGRARLAANDLSSGFIELTMSTGTVGRGVAAWDGDDGDSSVLDHTGLGGIDLTEGGANTAFRLAVGADHPRATATLRIYTDGDNWSSYTFPVTDTGSATPDTANPIIFDFSAFDTRTGSGADLTNVGAVQLEIQGVIDVQVGVDDLGMIGPTVMSADFANLETLTLGDMVWLDENNSGTLDPGETGIEGVVVNLYEDTDGDNHLTPDTDALLDSTITDSEGRYQFESLSPGDYVVQVDTVNFAVGGALASLLDSTGNDPAPDPDVDDNNLDDNGQLLDDYGVVSQAVTLQPDSEPVADGDSEANTNLSVDFGFTPASDLLVLKSDDTDPVRAGDQLTYTLHVTNNGPSPVTGVAVVDTLPAEVAFQSAAPSQGTAEHEGGVVTAELGELGAGVTADIQIVVIVDPSTTAETLLNTAVVSGDNYDPNPSNNTAQEPTAVERTVDLIITKSESPDPVVAGGLLSYTLQVTNAGPSDATGVTVSDVLPNGLSFISGSSARGTVTESDGIVTADIGDLAAGADPVEITLTVAVDPAARGTLLNEAEVSGMEEETDDSNNTASASTQIEALIDLGIEKSASTASVTAGGRLVYTLLVTNNGPSDATGVTVTDELPQGIAYVSGSSDQGTVDESGGTVTIHVGAMDAGAAAVEITIEADVEPSARGTLVNQARVYGAEDETDLTNNQDTLETAVAPQVDLAITKTDATDPVVAGQQLTYTLMVTNNGPSNATDVELTDTLPDEVAYASAASSQGTVSESGGVVSVDLGDLAVGEFATATIVVDVAAAARGTITNRAVVTLSESEVNTANNVALEPTAVDELFSSIAGFVYYDGNNDGKMSGDEHGLSGITIRLIGVDVAGHPVSLETVTGADGSYRFEDLRTGRYRLVEQQPGQYVDGRETVGSLPASLDANDEFSDIELPPGVDATDYLFGERGRPLSKRRFLSSS